MKKKSYLPYEEEKSMASEPMEHIPVSSRPSLWGRFAGVSDTMKRELATYLLNSLSPRRQAIQKKTWANVFAGAWKDHRTPEESVDDIRNSRSNNREISL